MDFTVVSVRQHDYDRLCGQAVADGLNAVGIDACVQDHLDVQTTHVACWGWRVGGELVKRGHEVLVMELGYLGERLHWYSLGWNGLNNRAKWKVKPGSSDRFTHNFSMQPWKGDGETVLIMGQVPGDASLCGKDLRPWYADCADIAKTFFGLPVVFRPHPMAHHIKSIYGCRTSTAPLEEDLNKAAYAITWNSNSAVDAVLAGVPTVSMDYGSMAWDVTSHEIGVTYKPDRSSWANKLAWRQWRLKEISAGLPFTHEFLGEKDGLGFIRE